MSSMLSFLKLDLVRKALPVSCLVVGEEFQYRLTCMGGF